MCESAALQMSTTEAMVLSFHVGAPLGPSRRGVVQQPVSQRGHFYKFALAHQREALGEHRRGLEASGQLAGQGEPLAAQALSFSRLLRLSVATTDRHRF